MAEEYIAFISYRHRPLDTAVTTRLHRLIEHYRVPKELRRGGKKNVGRVFRDRDELPLSSDLTAELRAALDHSEFLIVVCTPDTPQSIWVDREIEYFLRSHGRDNVLAVLAAGTQDTAFPRRLTEVYAEDGVTVVEQVEPLAANIADETNPMQWADHLLPHRQRVLRRLRGESLRLMAALLHCPYDALRQRQKQYRQRRALAAASAAAAVAAAFAVMLFNRNREIARQMRLAQENGSYALALLSGQQLAGGDRIGALESALAALPSGDGGTAGRPYRAEAERALADALYTYQPARAPRANPYGVPLPYTLRAASAVQQDTNIADILVSAAGDLLFALDENSTLRCYTVADGELRWQYGAPVPALLTAQWGADGQTLVCVTPDRLLLLDTADGSVEGSTAIAGDDLPAAVAAALSPDGTELLTLHPLPGRAGYTLVFRSLPDGAVRTAAGLPCPLSEGRQTPDLFFSPDGSRWGLHVVDQSVATNAIVVVDILLGTVQDGQMDAALEPYITTNTVQCLYAPDNGLLVAESAGTALTVQRFAEGGAQPQQEWEIGFSQWLDSSEPWAPDWHQPLMWCYPWGDDLDVFWCYDGLLVIFDGNTGEHRGQLSLTDRALAMLPSDDGFHFYLVQADGDIVLVDASTASHPDVQQSLGVDAAQAAFGGFASGTLCIVPAQDATRALLYQPLGDTAATEPALPKGADADLSKGFYLLPDGRLLGSLCIDGQLYAALAGQDAPDEWTVWPLPRYFDYDRGTWDGADCLRGVSADGRFLQFDGLVLDTASGETFSLTQGLAWQQAPSTGAALAVSRPAAGHPSYSVWAEVGGGLLYCARDMSTASLIPLPEGCRLAGPVGVGANGLAVAMVEDAHTAPRLAVCDLEKGAWTLPDAAVPADARTCAAEQAPLAAALGEDGVCRIFDLAAGTVAEIPLPTVPAETVAELRFAGEDALLLVRQSNGLLHILDIGQGTAVCTLHLEGFDDTLGARASELVVQADAENGRLYLGDRAGRMKGICFDRASWQVTAEAPGLMCYLPAARMLLCRDGDTYFDHHILLFPTRTLGQLQQQARALLAGP